MLFFFHVTGSREVTKEFATQRKENPPQLSGAEIKGEGVRFMPDEEKLKYHRERHRCVVIERLSHIT